MDSRQLAIVALQIKLDLLAVRCSTALTDERVPHVLIKGPTTARWLYQPPRPYSDVDLLVPSDIVKRAAQVLVSAGVAAGVAGRVGEQASHSLLTLSSDGAEIDLHRTLPAMPTPLPGRPGPWPVLARHVELLDIDGTSVPMLDVAGRCLVVALHAIGDPKSPSTAQAREDLRRARQLAPADWEPAFALARELGVEPLVRAGLSTVEQGWSLAGVPAHVRLRLAGLSGAELQLARMRELGGRDTFKLLWTEAFPSRAFLRRASRTDLSTTELAMAYASRWKALAGLVAKRTLASGRRQKLRH